MSFREPGTSQSLRAALTWFSAISGTVIVTPSRGPPGSWRYSSAKVRPASSSDVREMLGRDARRLVAHEVVARQEEAARVFRSASAATLRIRPR